MTVRAVSCHSCAHHTLRGAPWRTSTFGPVLSVIRYDTVEQAIAIADDSDYRLSAGVWTRDAQTAFDVAEALEAGMVWINDWHLAPPQCPFGGVKQSGIGREGGPGALDEYTEQKFVSFDLSGGVEGKAYGLLFSTPPS
ncbi:aldehyde dehydrogenase family protein [Nonomuraea sp. NPDC050556]|uniref:aldehyde dehydrogenase family protein n=1 Tax=Nonomuraea sp. NPDC050556 TaxID=3364369 RepID=UPI00378CAA46